MRRLLITTCFFMYTFLTGCHLLSDSMSSFYHSDPSITENIRQVFASNPQLAGVPIQIVTVKGNVQLSGYVKTIRQSDIAADVASHVDGVKFVENHLIVRK